MDVPKKVKRRKIRRAIYRGISEKLYETTNWLMFLGTKTF